MSGRTKKQNHHDNDFLHGAIISCREFLSSVILEAVA
jgi:hypothetical protein